MNEIIYAVYAEQLEENRLLGYACGDKQDIEAYFFDSRGYGLTFKPVNPVHVPINFAETRAALVKAKKKLEDEVRAIDTKLRDIQHELD